MKSNALALCIGAAIVAAQPAFAGGGNGAVNGLTGGTQFTSYNANGDTVGWFFNVTSPIIATELGFWDAGQNGLTQVHEVAIWEVSTQAMLGVVTVDNSSPLIGQWRYEALGAPIPLAPGINYVIGAFYHATSTDNYISGVTAIDADAVLSITGSARDDDSTPGVLRIPTISGPANGRFGPNFLYVVPSPGAIALLGMAGLVGRRRRRS